MEPWVIAVIGIVLTVAIFAFRGQPWKNKTFYCANRRCPQGGRAIAHSRRSWTAVQEGKRAFCDDCHSRWLEDKRREAAVSNAQGVASSGGCLILICVGAGAVFSLRALLW